MQVDKVDNGSGNTISSPDPQKSVVKDKKKAPQVRNWCFTYNNYVVDQVDNILDSLKSVSVKGIFGLEKGASGTPHLQGFLTFKNGRRLEGVKKILDGAHWEIAKGNAAQNYAYCKKDGNYKIWGDWPQEIEDEFLKFEPHWWQKDILELCKKKPDGRKIYWYWDAVGNVGKTCLAKHICLTQNAIYVGGKAGDIKFAIAKMEKKPSIVLFACPRVNEGFMSYAALEECADGIFFSTKFESGMVIMNKPHVIVFANFEPDRSKLSADRWVVVDIGATF